MAILSFSSNSFFFYINFISIYKNNSECKVERIALWDKFFLYSVLCCMLHILANVTDKSSTYAVYTKHLHNVPVCILQN